MGWKLFACFGCTTQKRKRRTRDSELGPKIRRIQEYQQLHSVVKDVHEDEDIRYKKPKDEKKARIRKKVRFNLDVVTYEPISDHDANYEQEDAEQEDLEQDENAAAATAATAAVCLVYSPDGEADSVEPGLSLQSVPANYRYSNWYDDEDNYDDNEDSECELSDLSDEDDDNATDEHNDLSSMPLISSATDTYSRRHYAVQVLKPIENISQWKAIKAKNVKS